MEHAFQLLRSGTEEEREAAAGKLMAVGQSRADEVVGGLQAILSLDDADARWWAVRVLEGVPGPEAAWTLVDLLSDQDEDVQVCAIVGLGERKEAEAVESLLACLGRANGYVARHIGDALSKIGEPAADGLIAALGDKTPAVRAQAARALVRIESQQAIPALIRALDDPEPTVEHYAWEALQRMGVGVTVLFQP